MQDLSNREIASGILIMLFAAWAFYYEPVRKPVKQLIKTALSPKLVTPVLLNWFWIGLGVYLLSKVSFWDQSLLKETVIWSIFSGIAILYLGVNSDDPNTKYLQSLKSQFAAGALIVFYVNLVEFPLYVEIPFLAVVLFLLLLDAFAEIKEEHQSVKKFTGCILALIGLSLLAVATWNVFHEPKLFFSVQAAISFTLPIALVMWTLPFGYIVALLAAYERLIVRLNMKRHLPFDMRFYISLKLLAVGNLNATRVKRIDKLLSRNTDFATNHDLADNLFSKLGETLKDPDNVDSRDFIWPERELFEWEKRYKSMSDYREIAFPICNHALALWDEFTKTYGNNSGHGILPERLEKFLTDNWPEVDGLYQSLNNMHRPPREAERFDRELQGFCSDLHDICWYYSPVDIPNRKPEHRTYLVHTGFKDAAKRHERLLREASKLNFLSRCHQ